MHTAQDTFMAHIFYCEPSSGALCKTIEAACKVFPFPPYVILQHFNLTHWFFFQLRYQKCLDAHPQGLGTSSMNLHTPGSSIGAALKSFVGSLRGRKSKSADSWDEAHTLLQDTYYIDNTVEREVIKHKHLQSPLTPKYFTNNTIINNTSLPSANLRSLLSPTMELRHMQIARWDSVNNM